MRNKWTNKELEILKNLYPNNTTKFISTKLNRSNGSIYSQAFLLGLKKDEKYINPGKIIKGSKIGKSTQFKKGQLAWNSNTKGLTHSNKTSFKKGNKPFNYKPIGSTRINKEGYKEIKVNDPNKWKLYHRFIWEEHNGPISQGCIVVFKDGNKSNLTIENLELITYKDNMYRNTIHRFPEEIKTTIKTLTILKKIIKNNGKE